MKKVKKIKKPKLPSLPSLQKKSDRESQNWGRRTYKKCEVCGKKMNVLHHFFPKQMSNRLRYEEDNLIPLCNSCHFRHHKMFDPSIHAKIIEKRGLKWFDKLNKMKKRKIKINRNYYNKTIKKYEK